MRDGSACASCVEHNNVVVGLVDCRVLARQRFVQQVVVRDGHGARKACVDRTTHMDAITRGGGWEAGAGDAARDGGDIKTTDVAEHQTATVATSHIANVCSEVVDVVASHVQAERTRAHQQQIASDHRAGELAHAVVRSHADAVCWRGRDCGDIVASGVTQLNAAHVRNQSHAACWRCDGIGLTRITRHQDTQGVQGRRCAVDANVACGGADICASDTATQNFNATAGDITVTANARHHDIARTVGDIGVVLQHDASCTSSSATTQARDSDQTCCVRHIRVIHSHAFVFSTRACTACTQYGDSRGGCCVVRHDTASTRDVHATASCGGAVCNARDRDRLVDATINAR